MRVNLFVRCPFLLRAYLETCLKPRMEQRGTATLARATVSTLHVGSPKEDYFHKRTISTVSSSLSKSWASCSCSLPSQPLQDQSLLMDDISPLMDMERELYGGSNESLAENHFGAEILSSQDSISDYDRLSGQEVDNEQGEDVSEDDINLDEYVIAEISSEDDEEDEEGERESNEGDISFSPSISTLASISNLSLQREETLKVVPIKYRITANTAPLDHPSPAPPPPSQQTASAMDNSQGPSMKPPNVLIYTGCIKPGEEYDLIRYRLQKCLDPDSYLVYFLSSAQLDKVPWKDNAALLVLFCSDLDDIIRRHAIEFCLAGGRCLNFFWGAHSSLLSSIQELEDQLQAGGGCVQSKFVDKDSIHTSLRPHMLHVIEAKFPGGGKALIFQQDLIDNEKDYPKSHERRLEVLRLMLGSKLGIFCVKRPQEHPLTPCFLIHRNQEDQGEFRSKLEPRLNSNGKLSTGNGVTLHFFKEGADGSSTATPSPDYLPVHSFLLDQVPKEVPFDASKYFDCLQTKQLGRHVFYTQVVPTTMTLLEGLTDFPGAIAITQRQTQGKGRGGNNWVSPEGCAMFTLFLSVPLHSNLGHNLPFLQHLVSIALVHSVRSKASLKDLDLRLKWPNDIYYGRQAKVGGLIIKTTLLRDTFHCFIGCGVNVSNSQPTICINDLIRKHNRKLTEASSEEEEEAGPSEAKSEVPLLSVEEYIARSLTHLELLIEDYQSHGSSSCMSLYYKYWCHDNQEVTLAETNEKATVEGIDDNGFLLVTTSSGKVVSLQPDGNSFDLLKNLIAIKTHP